MGKNIDLSSEVKWFPANRSERINLVGWFGNEQNSSCFWAAWAGQVSSQLVEQVSTDRFIASKLTEKLLFCPS